MSIDALIRPDIIISQPDKGFRFGTDSAVLAWFTTVKKHEKIIDIGAGSGVLSVLLAKVKIATDITAVELQPEMFACLEESIRLSKVEDKITVIHSDIKNYRPQAYFHLAICNPPYRPKGIGKVSEDSINNTARFTDDMALTDVLGWCRSYLHYGGRLAFCGDADRLIGSICECREYGFEPKRLMFLHSEVDKKAKLFFMECIRGGGEELSVEAPMVQTDNIIYTNMLQGIWN